MVNKCFFFIIAVVLFISCDKQNEVIITNQDRLEFLIEVLSDTTELKIIKSKDQLISNSPIFSKPFFWTIDKDDNIEEYKRSAIKYISDTLGIYDTIFIKAQMKQNRYFDMDELADYGFRMFDTKYYIEYPEIDWEVKKSKIDSLNIGKSSFSVLHISKPIFNKNLDLAYIEIRQGSSGSGYILEKKNQKWVKKSTISGWVE